MVVAVAVAVAVVPVVCLVASGCGWVRLGERSHLLVRSRSRSRIRPRKSHPPGRRADPASVSTTAMARQILWPPTCTQNRRHTGCTLDLLYRPRLYFLGEITCQTRSQ